MKKYSSDRECMIKSFIYQRYDTGLVVRHENGKIGSRPVHDSKTWFGSCLEISATLITLRNFIVLTQTVQVTN